MPTYKYKCKDCNAAKLFQMPISADPRLEKICHKCGSESMTRRITPCVFPEKVGKVFADKWFKETYGHELGADAATRVELERDLKAMKEKHERETQ